MSNFKLGALIGIAGLMSWISSGWVGASESIKPSVRLSTNPAARQTLPFEAEAATSQSPVRLQLQAVDAANQPLKQAKVNLQLLTPPKNFWLPTDFPVVEGTKLLEMEANAPDGKLQFQQALPIRGTYQLVVKVTPVVANAFPPFQQTLQLPVSENSVKLRNFGILAAILLVVGLGGGLVLGGKQQIQPGEIAPQPVRLLLSGATVVAIAALLIINISAELSQSHAHRQHAHSSNPAALQSQGLTLQLSGQTHATVGQPIHLAAQVRDTTTGKPATDVILKIKTTQLEDHWVALAYQSTTDRTGKLAWQQQFFDGAPHQVVVEVSPQPKALRQFRPFQVSQGIEVEGVAPPLATRLIALAYLTSIVILGLGVGLWLRPRLA